MRTQLRVVALIVLIFVSLESCETRPYPTPTPVAVFVTAQSSASTVPDRTPVAPSTTPAPSTTATANGTETATSRAAAGNTAIATAHPTASHLVSPYSRQPLPTPANGALVVLGLSFSDPQHGWAVASVYDPGISLGWTVVLSTTDGGRRWDLVPAPNAVGYAVDSAPELPVLNQIAFTSRLDGTLSGTRRFVTHDGGLSWHDAGPVAAGPAPISLSSGHFHLQTRNCVQTGFNGESSCEYRLWKSLDENNWVPAPIAFQAVTAWLAQGSSRVAWTVSYTRSSDASQVAGHLLRTGDGGRTWLTLPDLPHAELLLFGGFWFYPVDETDIWLVAGDAGAGPWGGKTIIVSRDGGQTWDLRASVRIDGSHRIGNICAGCGYLRNFTPVTASKAFMGLGRGTLLGTKDGGRTWYEAIPYEIVNPDDGVAGPAYFIDPLHGWVISRAGLFRTTDGGDTWTTGSAPGLPGLPGRVVTPLPPWPTPGSSPTQNSYPGPPIVTPSPPPLPTPGPSPTLHSYPGFPSVTPSPGPYP